jgi:hypothetical protein
MEPINWINAATQPSKKYRCGHCGNPLASDKAYVGNNQSGESVAFLYVCHHCYCPTLFSPDGEQHPGEVFGNKVSDIEDQSVADLYEEARRCTSSNAHTAAVLACRKLLMHIAVAKGAKAGENFVYYVEYLADKNYIPPDARDWVDHIRKKGNEANHEIVIMKADDAKDLLAFIEMLLRIIYEFPATIKRKVAPRTVIPPTASP